ncbi:S41 family peptidase [Patescibacteria group bacterium]|nr:S41 family peptidase [Patescibacteria group bacterium]
MDIIKEKIKPIKRSRIWLTVFVLMAVSFAAGLNLSTNRQKNVNQQIAYSPESQFIQNEPSFNFNLYWEVWNRLKSDYVDKNMIEDEEMFYGSLRGLASSMNDPYTIFMDPTEAKEFADDLSGTFEGIGAEVGMRNDIVTVIAPLSGMPAEKAGLRSGDKVYAIDNVSTLGLSIDQAVKKIRGPKDTPVKLTVIREGEDRPMDITIIRGLIVVKSVKTNFREDGVFVITVSNFNDDTIDLFNQAIKEILTKNPKGIVLDLRNNPGGYLDTAISMASAWVKEGPVVVEQFGEGRRQEYFADGNNSLGEFKTVILINGGSASASEIVAGALRDYHKASLVGEQSYGKGSVQSLRDLSDGSTLKVTVAKWLTPAGDFIDEKGITPEYEVKLTKEDVDSEKDPQMDKALELILKQEINNKK